MTPAHRRQLAEQTASAIWADVDWLESQEQAARDAPGAVGVPLSLIGDATKRIADRIDSALSSAYRAGQIAALKEAATFADEHGIDAGGDELLDQDVVAWLRARASQGKGHERPGAVVVVRRRSPIGRHR